MQLAKLFKQQPDDPAPSPAPQSVCWGARSPGSRPGSAAGTRASLLSAQRVGGAAVCCAYFFLKKKIEEVSCVNEKTNKQKTHQNKKEKKKENKRNNFTNNKLKSLVKKPNSPTTFIFVSFISVVSAVTSALTLRSPWFSPYRRSTKSYRALI